MTLLFWRSSGWGPETVISLPQLLTVWPPGVVTPVAQTLLVSRPLPLAFTVTVASNIWLRRNGATVQVRLGRLTLLGAGTALM